MNEQEKQAILGMFGVFGEQEDLWQESKADAPTPEAAYDEWEFVHRNEVEPIDSWTGRPTRIECICLSSPHPDCPQHGEKW